MSRSRKNKKSKRAAGFVVFLVILSLISLAVLASCAFVSHYLGKIERTPEEVVDVVPPSNEDFETDTKPADVDEVSPEEIDWSDAIPPGDDHLINILLVGQDRRAGQGRQRADTMILCSINTETKEISFISFLRDLYVQIPGGYAPNRLNATYAFGGFDLLDGALNANFGITVDGNVEVDFSRFVQIIDALGGVSIYLTSAEAPHVVQTEYEGTYRLTGEQALSYARLRVIDDDFGRANRQRNVLSALVNKAKKLSLSEMLTLLDTILPSLTTDMTDKEIITTATKLFPLLSDVKVSSYQVPSDGTYYGAYVNGMAVLVPNIEQICIQLKEEYLPLG